MGVSLRCLWSNPFRRAILVLVVAYLFFANAFPPLMPLNLLLTFMLICFTGILLYYSAEDRRWEEFKQPLRVLLYRESMKVYRWLLVAVVSLLIGWLAFGMLEMSNQPPPDLRQAHPAPPEVLNAYGKNFRLSRLENPLRSKVLTEAENDPKKALESYRKIVNQGRALYYENCVFCHGARLDGEGKFAAALNPRPTNFRDLGTIAQLQESYLFWRITKGATGLPAVGAPWNSTMPAWEGHLDADQTWSLIVYLYDEVGQVPRVWDSNRAKQIDQLNELRISNRSNTGAAGLYQRYCAGCHGLEGTGDGPAATRMYPAPRDFSLGLFKFKSSPPQMLPRDEDIFESIKFGLRGSGMPAWSQLLTDAQIRSLIPVLKAFDTTARWAPEGVEDEDFDEDGHYLKTDYQRVSDLEPVDGQVAYSLDSLGRGQVMYEKVCAKCHGLQGRGNITSGKRLTDDWDHRIWPRNLTLPESWRLNTDKYAEYADRANRIELIYRQISTGIAGTPMPAHRAVEAGNDDPVSREDRWHIANYVFSLGGQSLDSSQPPILRAVYTSVDLPESVTDGAWSAAEPVRFMLAPNLTSESRLFKPLNESVQIRALLNDDSIAFLIEADDRTQSRPGNAEAEAIQDNTLPLYQDALAIRLGSKTGREPSDLMVKPLLQHGRRQKDEHLWFWGAGSEKPAVESEGSVRKGYPIDRGPEKPLIVDSRWKDGRWRVLMKGPIGAARYNAQTAYVPISLATWDGSNGEIGGRHSLTAWGWLRLSESIGTTWLYGLSFLAAVASLVLLSVLMCYLRLRNSAASV